MSAVFLRAARLLTGRGDEVIEDTAVYVAQGRIVAAGPAATVPQPADAGVTLVEYPGATILPGLVDAHVHLTWRRGMNVLGHAQVPDEQALLSGVQAARRVLAAGVTTVRDCGTRTRLAQRLRDGVRDSTIAGPRILASGPPVTTTAGHLWPIGYEADSAVEGRAAVRRLVKEGADFVKVCATGGGNTPGSVSARAQYTVDELSAIAGDAHRLGRPVAAHAHGTEGMARAVQAGIDTIEHCSWTDESGAGKRYDDEVARMMAAQGTFANIAGSAPRPLVEHDWRQGDPAPGSPLLAAVRRLREQWDLVRRMGARGVRLCLSSDAIYGYWEDGHDLLYLAQLLVEAGGFRPLEVIPMITSTAAGAAGLADQVGTVEAGKVADLLVVDGDPSTDFRAMHRTLAVYQAGADVTHV